MSAPAERKPGPGPVKLALALLLIVGGGLWLAVVALIVAAGFAMMAETAQETGVPWGLVVGVLIVAPPGPVAIVAGIGMLRPLLSGATSPEAPGSARTASSGGRGVGYVLLLAGIVWLLLAGGCTVNFMSMAGPGPSILLPIGIGLVCIAPAIVCLWLGLRILRRAGAAGR